MSHHLDSPIAGQDVRLNSTDLDVCRGEFGTVLLTPAMFSFAGWNGRAFSDHTPEVMLNLATNTAITMGIGPDSVAAVPSQRFPYVPTAD
jgi:hypothetical protein